MKRLFLITFIFFCFLFNYSGAQYNRYLIDSEKRLKNLFDTLFKRDDVRYILSDSLKIVYSDSIAKELLSVLHIDNSFNYPFDLLERLGKITSGDSLVRIFTWNIRFNDGSYKYYGFIQKRASKNESKTTIFVLNDYSDSIPEKDLEQVILNHKKWYGAIYYQIAHYTYQNQTYYILIGWDGYSRYINRKVVEVLYFNAKGKPVFGKSVFKSDEKTVKRLIFNHSIKASMTCRYEEKLKAIVFDHLVPSSPVFKGMYEFYGPNGTYDAYFLKNNLWIYKQDIEAKNPPPKK
jgi:hypothetical protein